MAEIESSIQARNLRVFVMVGGAIAVLVVAIGMFVMLTVSHGSDASARPERPVVVPVAPAR